MISFPCAKINIGLNILNKRPDGYHNIETLFVPVKWSDALEIVPAADGIFKFSQKGLKIPGSERDNLCVKAYEIMKNKFNLPPVEIYLYKNIPTGAGLGGGSSDAAFTLSVINKMFKLGCTDEILKEFALELGSDCPFFINPCITYATGRGEMFEKTDINLENFNICIVKPDIHINTARAYSIVKPDNKRHKLKEILDKSNVYEWKDLIFNDFEKGLENLYPFINDTKAKLYENGAVYASLSGSGSAVYGIFKDNVPANLKELFADCAFWSGEIMK